jgi:hypothetical protein
MDTIRETLLLKATNPFNIEGMSGTMKVVVIIAIVIIIIILYSKSQDDGMIMIQNTTIPLNKKEDLIMANIAREKILGNSSSTVMGFFKLNGGDRTANYTTPYIPIMQVEQNWSLEISPTPQGTDHNVARLRVTTSKAGTNEDQMIDLPEIPKQRWVFIAILRDGRRFDVIYDNKIVASHRLREYPVIIPSPLSVGNAGLDGFTNYIMINEKRLAPADVEAVRLSYVDTNGIITEKAVISLSLPSIKFTDFCLPGFPCNFITAPPANNLVKWNSPYA